ncbi:hypothetical protein A2U01_0032963 [Trifolium medium]|uniref:Uncharacterized protein n=1 Tax=Trifolium medium TaxID=97028 RepID=A0A392PIF6_9FABA|nr:hypothetical protein [Trifolium medium]
MAMDIISCIMATGRYQWLKSEEKQRSKVWSLATAVPRSVTAVPMLLTAVAAPAEGN